MSIANAAPPSIAEIMGRLVDAETDTMSVDSARAILRLHFGPSDVQRMNDLAAINRKGLITPAEYEELDNYVRAGKALAILQSRARLALPDEEREAIYKRLKS